MNYNSNIILFVLIIILIYLYNNTEIVYNSLINCKDHIGIPNKCTKYNNYLKCNVHNHKYIINPKDSVVSHPIKCGNYWESWMHEYFKKYSDKNKICLDIGANIGAHTVVLSNLFYKVHSFEPQYDVFKILQENINVNNCTNVIPYNVGLGNKSEVVKMKCFDKQNSYNVGSVGIVNNEEGCEKINVVTLDSLYLENIALIKIDVEGYEYNAFLGGLQTIKHNKPVIIFEEHNPNSKVFGLLKSLNYNINKISYLNDYIAIQK